MTKQRLLTIALVCCFCLLALPLADASPLRNFVVAAGGAAVAWTAFRPKDAPYTPEANSLRDKLILITGGTAGLGLESAKRLAAAGATVVLTSRTANKGEKAVEEVQSYVKDRHAAMANAADVSGQHVYSATLDLDDLEGVKGFPERLDAVLGSDLQQKKIDVLMNNAGIMAVPDRQITKDGFERTFQSNHLGHFVLTSTLFDRLASKARIINVSSDAHKIGIMGLPVNDNLNGEKHYGAWYNYGTSKLANILFTNELQRRVGTSGMKAFSLHPGVVQTDLVRHMIGEDRWDKIVKNGPSGFYEKAVVKTLGAIAKTVEQGASTQVYLAGASDQTLNAAGGAYYCNMKPVGFMLPAAKDSNVAQQLWVESEKLGKVSFVI